MTILIVGDANADLSAKLPAFPTEGDDCQLDQLGWGSGGSSANVATALALLGSSARLLARVGRDPAADIALRAARAAGVDLTAIQVDDTLATGLCFAAISPGGERTFFSFRGANLNLSLTDGIAALNGARWLHFSAYSLIAGAHRNTMLALIDEASRRTIPLSLDLCLPALRTKRAEMLALLPRLQILFANQNELAVLDSPPITSPTAHSDATNAASPSAALAAAERARCHGAKIVAVKLGDQGCAVAAEGLQRLLPALAVDAVDTNGCGDAFVGGFLHAHLQGAPPDACALLGNTLGALTAARYGAADALPDRAQLQAYMS